jgi:hypothetical protein
LNCTRRVIYSESLATAAGGGNLGFDWPAGRAGRLTGRRTGPKVVRANGVPRVRNDSDQDGTQGEALDRLRPIGIYSDIGLRLVCAFARRCWCLMRRWFAQTFSKTPVYDSLAACIAYCAAESAAGSIDLMCWRRFANGISKQSGRPACTDNARLAVQSITMARETWLVGGKSGEPAVASNRSGVGGVWPETWRWRRPRRMPSGGSSAGPPRSASAECRPVGAMPTRGVEFRRKRAARHQMGRDDVEAIGAIGVLCGFTFRRTKQRPQHPGRGGLGPSLGSCHWGERHTQHLGLRSGVANKFVVMVRCAAPSAVARRLGAAQAMLNLEERTAQQ